jgi:hypothetical protein
MGAIVGKAHSVRFDFMDDGEYVVPTIGSVTYTIYNNAGVAISGQTAVAVTTLADTNYISLAIPSSVQTLDSAKSFEQRTVFIDYTVAGKSQTQEKHYFVTNRLNVRVTPRDVISYLSIKDGEIFEDEVQITPAYFTVRDTLGSAVFDAALSSGDMTQLRVNEAVKLQAAMYFLTTLELRALRKAGGDGASFNRFEKIDFKAMRVNIQQELATALNDVGGATSIPTLIMVTSPTDIYTG